MGYSVLETVKNSFNSDMKSEAPQNLTRFLGGHGREGHPYVNGYWQFFVSPPKQLFNGLEPDINIWLHTTAEGFTPPSRNVNKADVPGQGGLGSSWVTGQSLQRNFSITHREYRDVPLLRIFQLWTSVIIPHIGISEIPGSRWMGTSYKGHAFVILTKPTGHDGSNSMINRDDIEELFYFDGIWPENEPVDVLQQDISANDIVQYSINYSFDGWPLTKMSEAALNKAIDLLNDDRFKYQNTYDLYERDVDVMHHGLVGSYQAT